jgi:hypothetical protein
MFIKMFQFSDVNSSITILECNTNIGIEIHGAVWSQGLLGCDAGHFWGRVTNVLEDLATSIFRMALHYMTSQPRRSQLETSETWRFQISRHGVGVRTVASYSRDHGSKSWREGRLFWVTFFVLQSLQVDAGIVSLQSIRYMNQESIINQQNTAATSNTETASRSTHRCKVRDTDPLPMGTCLDKRYDVTFRRLAMSLSSGTGRNGHQV